MDGLGSNLSEIKQRIQKAQDELAGIGIPEQPLPEVINMTNLLRANEYLTKTGEKKTELILAFEEYAKQLEQIVSSLLSIQTDLRDIVKTEAEIIGSKQKTAKKTRTKARKRKNTKKRSK
jgi:hypothetical protein